MEFFQKFSYTVWKLNLFGYLFRTYVYCIQYKNGQKYSIHVQRIHEKIKNYFCDICDYKCFEKHSLNAHLTTHNPEAKTFLCDQCSSAFARMGHLSRHKKEVHLKEKLQKCSDCPMEYQTRTELKNHLIQVMGSN